MRNLTLIIPGLLGPDARFSDDYVPSVPALELLLSRASHSLNDSPEYHRTLANLMQVGNDPDQDVPVAAITRFMDNDQDIDGTWMRADPVHLSPDRDGLVLMDSFILNLNQHDALAIANEANYVLKEYGLSIEVPYEDRWYIRVDEELDLITTELSTVVGNDISAYLPRGKDSGKIHSMLNEVQMHLFNSEINKQREKRGELAVNSIWLWGVGKISGIARSKLSVVFSDDVYAACLAGLASASCFPAPRHLLGIQDHTKGEGDVIVTLMQCLAPSQYQNLQLWQKALMLLEGSWFVPALEWLQQGKLRNLRIICDGHAFQLGRLGLRKFWKKPVPISHYRQIPGYAKNG